MTSMEKLVEDFKKQHPRLAKQIERKHQQADRKEVSEDELRNRAALVGEVGRELQRLNVSFESLLCMIKYMMEQKAWTHFLTKVDEEVSYPDTPEGFRAFIAAPRINGLGTTPEELEQSIKQAEESLRLVQKALDLKNRFPDQEFPPRFKLAEVGEE